MDFQLAGPAPDPIEHVTSPSYTSLETDPSGLILSGFRAEADMNSLPRVHPARHLTGTIHASEDVLFVGISLSPETKLP